MHRTPLALALVTILALTLALGTAYAEDDPARVDAPVHAEGVLAEAQEGTLVLDGGTTPVVASITEGYVEVWTKQIPCLDRQEAACMTNSADTQERSLDASQGSLSIAPRADQDTLPVIGIRASEDAVTRVESENATLDLRPEDQTRVLAEDSDAPESMQQITLEQGADVHAPLETNLSVQGSFEVLAMDARVTVQNDDGQEDLVTGWSWQENGNGGITYYRTLTLIRAPVDGQIAVSTWEGTLQHAPVLPMALEAEQATLDILDGTLGNASSDAGETTLETPELTFAGVEWSQEDEASQGPGQGFQPGSEAPEGWFLVEPHIEQATPPPAPDETATSTTVIGISGAAFATVALVAYYWPRVSWLTTVGVLPLYSRIEKDELLDHEARKRLFGLVKDDPGIHAHALAEAADLGWGTTVYHLRRLEQNGFVTSERKGRYRRFFPASGFVERTREVLSVLQNDNTNAIAHAVLEDPGLNQSEICEELDISPSLANWHLNQLLDAGLIERERRGRTVHYTPGPSWEEVHQTVDLPVDDALLDQTVPLQA